MVGALARTITATSETQAREPQAPKKKLHILMRSSLNGVEPLRQITLKPLFIALISLLFVSANGSAFGDSFVYSGGVFTSFGNTATEAQGINDNGQIVGLRGNSGFLYDGGAFTSLNYPGAVQTDAFDINSSGQIVGYYADATGVHGFLDNAGTFSSLNYPGAHTKAFGINDSGQIVGAYTDGISGAFLYDAGTFTSLKYPGAHLTEAFGINNSGEIVGFYQDQTGGHGFLYDGGTFTSLDYPGSAGTTVYGINLWHQRLRPARGLLLRQSNQGTTRISLRRRNIH